MGREGYHSALPLARTQAGGRGANLKGTTMRVVYSGVLAAVFSMSAAAAGDGAAPTTDRKSTRLNSSHSQISYAVFCLKKKNATLVRTLPPTQSRTPPSESRNRLS